MEDTKKLNTGTVGSQLKYDDLAIQQIWFANFFFQLWGIMNDKIKRINLTSDPIYQQYCRKILWDSFDKKKGKKCHI